MRIGKLWIPCRTFQVHYFHNKYNYYRLKWVYMRLNRVFPVFMNIHSLNLSIDFNLTNSNKQLTPH